MINVNVKQLNREINKRMLDYFLWKELFNTQKGPFLLYIK